MTSRLKSGPILIIHQINNMNGFGIIFLYCCFAGIFFMLYDIKDILADILKELKDKK